MVTRNASDRSSSNYSAYAALLALRIQNSSHTSPIEVLRDSGSPARQIFRIIYAIDEKAKIVKLARILHRDRDYREFDQI